MSVQVELVCGGCGRIGRHRVRVKRVNVRCQVCGCKTLYSITTVARAGGVEPRNAVQVRLWSVDRRIEVIRAYEMAKGVNEERRSPRETRVEVRDGREYVVTVLPDAEAPVRRQDTHFHFSETDKQGDVGRGPGRRGKAKR